MINRENTEEENKTNNTTIQSNVALESNGNNNSGHFENNITKFILGGDKHPVNDDDEVIEYIGERIRAIENISGCTKLKKLLLRRNVIKKIENISHLELLEELELYDNQITKIENLESNTNLVVLDLSYNLIKKVENLDTLLNLKVLYLVENHFKKVINFISL